MNELVIKRTGFDQGLQNIQEFAKNLPTDHSFDRVEVDGTLLKFTNHQVTGAEMNHFIEKVQERLISVNTTFHSIIKEFTQIYQVFDSLDKEYVAGILQSLEEAHKACRAAQMISDENSRTLESLQKTVAKLLQLSSEFKEFKTISQEKLESLEMQISDIAKAVEKMTARQDSLQKRYHRHLTVAFILGGISIIASFSALFISVLR